jgi:hypothetical protein
MSAKREDCQKGTTRRRFAAAGSVSSQQPHERGIAAMALLLLWRR